MIVTERLKTNVFRLPIEKIRAGSKGDQHVSEYTSLTTPGLSALGNNGPQPATTCRSIHYRALGGWPLCLAPPKPRTQN